MNNEKVKITFKTLKSGTIHFIYHLLILQVGDAGASASAAAGPQPKKFVLKMWKDGFSLDDGDIRHYNDPQHRSEQELPENQLNLTF